MRSLANKALTRSLRVIGEYRKMIVDSCTVGGDLATLEGPAKRDVKDLDHVMGMIRRALDEVRT